MRGKTLLLRRCNKIIDANYQKVKCSHICPNSIEYLFKSYVIFGGEAGGHQKITLDYRGEGGGLGSPKKDYEIF